MATQAEMKDKYEGQTFDLRNGYTITVIEYINARNVRIKFDDGIIKTTALNTIKNRTIRHPDWTPGEWRMGYRYKDLIGKQFPVRHNQYVTIKSLQNASNVTIVWEDGAQSTTRLYVLNTIPMTLIHPDWTTNEWHEGYKLNELIGKKYKMKHRLSVTITNIHTKEDVDIVWDDGTPANTKLCYIQSKTLKHPKWTTSQWLKGAQSNKINKCKNQLIGQTIHTKNNLSFTIIDYQDKNNVIIRWNDGAINTTKSANIKRKSIKHPDWTKGEWVLGRRYVDMIGTIYFDKIGLPFTITDYKDCTHIHVTYADGTKSSCFTHQNLSNSNMTNPSLRIRTNSDGKCYTSGTLWDTKILNIAYTLNDIHYLTCEKPNGDRYITSVPDLYEEKTGKLYPYHLLSQKHTKGE